MPAGCKFSGSVAYGKDAEEVYGVNGAVGEVGVQLDAGAEAEPECPVAVGDKGSGRYDSGASRCCHSAEVSVEFVALERWQSLQPGACGYKE